MVGFLLRVIKICFVASLSSFQYNFELCKSVENCQSYALINTYCTFFSVLSVFNLKKSDPFFTQLSAVFNSYREGFVGACASLAFSCQVELGQNC